MDTCKDKDYQGQEQVQGMDTCKDKDYQGQEHEEYGFNGAYPYYDYYDQRPHPYPHEFVPPHPLYESRSSVFPPPPSTRAYNVQVRSTVSSSWL